MPRASWRGAHIISIARSQLPIARMQWWMRPGPRRSWAMTKPAWRGPSRFAVGDPAVLVADLAVAGAAVVAHHRHRPDQVEARRVGRHEDHRGAGVGVCLGVGDHHHDRDRGADRAGGEPLVAVDHPLAAVEHGAASAACAGPSRRPRARSSRSRSGSRRRAAAAATRSFCSGAAVLGDDLHVARVRRRAVEGHRGDRRAATHLLAEDPVLPVGEPDAVLGVRHEQVPETLRAGRVSRISTRISRIGAAGALT